MRRSEWSSQPGCELNGKTLVVVGLGPIGRATARIAHFGFGMRVLGLARTAGLAVEGVENVLDHFEAGHDVEGTGRQGEGAGITAGIRDRETAMTLGGVGDGIGGDVDTEG